MLAALVFQQPAYLDGKQVSSRPLFGKVHASKCTTADGLDDLKLINGHAMVVPAGAGNWRCCTWAHSTMAGQPQQGLHDPRQGCTAIWGSEV